MLILMSMLNEAEVSFFIVFVFCCSSLSLSLSFSLHIFCVFLVLVSLQIFSETDAVIDHGSIIELHLKNIARRWFARLFLF